jgi:hypothetical protein
MDKNFKEMSAQILIKRLIQSASLKIKYTRESIENAIKDDENDKKKNGVESLS